MLTFSINPSVELISKAGAAVLKKKPIAQYTEQERIGVSEAFVKTVDGKQTGSNVNICAYGYVVERNTKMAIRKKEIAIISLDEEKDREMGVADTVFKMDSHVEDERWLESLDFDLEAFLITFELVQCQVGLDQGENLRRHIQLALTASPKHVSRLTVLIEQYNDFGDLIALIRDNKPVPPKLSLKKDRDSLVRIRSMKVREQISPELEEEMSRRRSRVLKSVVKLEMINRVVSFLEHNDFKRVIWTLLDNPDVARALGIH
ncbi:hypothetical protein [uncultured Brevibacillus sp.]|uniref:hypothetical protein n=1 Tax=uncultured Brevibacillus sp. TaxID=169970 RepID=UPI002594D17F|nr:hypothetical protein [uncultured Brevibacillus sp.]